MTLGDAIFLVGEMPKGSTICAKKPFHRSSEAVIVQLTSDYRVPETIKESGYEYFLEQDIVQELLEMIEPKAASSETKVEFVIYYADFDAYPSFVDDLPDK